MIPHYALRMFFLPEMLYMYLLSWALIGNFKQFLKKKVISLTYLLTLSHLWLYGCHNLAVQNTLFKNHCTRVTLMSALFQSCPIFMSTELLCWQVLSLGTFCFRPHLLGTLYLIYVVCRYAWALIPMCVLIYICHAFLYFWVEAFASSWVLIPLLALNSYSF